MSANLDGSIKILGIIHETSDRGIFCLYGRKVAAVKASDSFRVPDGYGKSLLPTERVSVATYKLYIGFLIPVPRVHDSLPSYADSGR